MKHYFVLFFFLFFAKSYSQKSYTYKAVYELTYKQDSLGKDLKSQLVLLINNNKESLFQDYKKFKNDSIAINLGEGKGVGAFISEVITTNHAQQKIYINRSFDNAPIYYTEPIPNRWTMKNTESSVNGIKCKEASLQAYGRNWTACYAEDYPFQSGPYFFAGLPGLIVRVEDDQQFYQFRLQSFKKESNVIEAFASGLEVKKIKFYEMIYNQDFSGNIFNTFKMEDAAAQDRMRKLYMENIKKKNTYPIDRSMRYLFNK